MKLLSGNLKLYNYQNRFILLTDLVRLLCMNYVYSQFWFRNIHVFLTGNCELWGSTESP